MKNLQLDKLTLDKKYQIRINGLNGDAVEAFADAMKAGEKLPPITVYEVDEKLLVVDGWHRVQAARQADLKMVQADVRQGTEQEAYDFARFEANRKNGQRLSRADVTALVEKLVLEEQYAQTSNSELAKIANVSHTTIARVRERLMRVPATVIAKDGSVRKVARADLAAAPTPFITGAPQVTLDVPEDGGYRDLTDAVIKRLEEHLDNLIVSIDRLESAELSALVTSEAHQRVLSEMRRLEQLLEVSRDY